MENRIYTIARTQLKALYVIEHGAPTPINPEDCKERLRIVKADDGSLRMEQDVDTPLGIYPFSELYHSKDGILLEPVPLDECTDVRLELRRPDGGHVTRKLLFKDGKLMFNTYWKVDALGVVSESTEVWTDETFTCTHPWYSTWTSEESTKWCSVYDSASDARYYRTAFGDMTWHDRFAIGPKAEGEIRKAVRLLNEALQRNRVRMIYDQDSEVVKFIGDPKLEGWSCEIGEALSDEDEQYIAIPNCELRGLGLLSLTWVNDYIGMHIRKDTAKE